jgi:hypothetical protein
VVNGHSVFPAAERELLRRSDLKPLAVIPTR